VQGWHPGKTGIILTRKAMEEEYNEFLAQQMYDEMIHSLIGFSNLVSLTGIVLIIILFLVWL